MKVAVDIIRIFLTTSACLLFSVLINYLIENDSKAFISPILFGSIIVLTNLDKIRINKFKAIGLSLLLSFPVFFFTLLSTWGLILLIGQPGIVIMSVIAGMLIFLASSIYINMRSFKTGLILTGLLAGISVFILIIDLSNFQFRKSAGITPELELIFISWQTLVALGISIGIWLDINQKSSEAPNASI